jgi:hypothetical protein
MILNEYLERALKNLDEVVGGPGSYEDEKGIAMKMKAKGYKMVILFPAEMNTSPLYVKNLLSATQLMRKEFRNVKDYEIKKISEFVGDKGKGKEEEE